LNVQFPEILPFILPKWQDWVASEPETRNPDNNPAIVSGFGFPQKPMPTKSARITESVVEQAALDWLGGMGCEVLSGLTIAPGETAAERADYKQVFLFDRLQTKLEDLNPKIPSEGLEEALRKVRQISHPTLIENNRAFHRLLVEGVDVEFRNRKGQIVHDKVWLIDFANPENNEFLAVNQFTVEEGHFNRRADVVVFINGIPLAVLELKNIADKQATIRKAFDQFQTYKAQIPSACPAVKPHFRAGGRMVRTLLPNPRAKPSDFAFLQA
jgi:type I site-specific restriction-modification system R (restriction) subunit